MNNFFKKQAFPFLVALLLIGVGCSKKSADISLVPTADPLTGDPDQSNCGFDLGTDVPDGPIIDPCGSEAECIHGPVILDPDPASPAVDSVLLGVPEDGFICVTVLADRIASASATLNGEL